jgi:hypothetical protein
MNDIHLRALYEIHRHQILFNAKDASGQLNFPEGYLYAVANRVFPYFHSSWCGDEDDPFASCYRVPSDFMERVITDLDQQWLAGTVPTFYNVERKYGHEQRAALIDIFRYSFLSHKFDSTFYQSLLANAGAPTEANGLSRPFDESEIHLL